MMMFKAIQRKKLKAELESISKFFKELENCSDKSYSSNSSGKTKEIVNPKFLNENNHKKSKSNILGLRFLSIDERKHRSIPSISSTNKGSTRIKVNNNDLVINSNRLFPSRLNEDFALTPVKEHEDGVRMPTSRSEVKFIIPNMNLKVAKKKKFNMNKFSILAKDPYNKANFELLRMSHQSKLNNK